MILSTKCLFGFNLNPPTARDRIFWGEPVPNQGIPRRCLRVSFILTDAVSEFLLDALEDTAKSWTAEMRLESSASSSVSFFWSSFSASFCLFMAAATYPLILFSQGFFLPSELRLTPLSSFLWWFSFLPLPFLGGRSSKSSSLWASLSCENSGGLWYRSSTTVFGTVPTLKFTPRQVIWVFISFLDTLSSTVHAVSRWATAHSISACIPLTSFDTAANLGQILGSVQPPI